MEGKIRDGEEGGQEWVYYPFMVTGCSLLFLTLLAFLNWGKHLQISGVCGGGGEWPEVGADGCGRGLEALARF